MKIQCLPNLFDDTRTDLMYDGEKVGVVIEKDGHYLMELNRIMSRPSTHKTLSDAVEAADDLCQ